MWTEKKLIFKPTGTKQWSKSHAQVPFALPLNNGLVRVFYSTRDVKSCSAVSFIDVKAGNPEEIVYRHEQAVFQKGSAGSFDDSGTMPSWFVNNGDELWLYYTGWNRSETASYRLAIGLAVSKDNGLSFERKFLGPILDRGKNDPIWVAQPCVLQEEDIWKMWYLSCQRIETINHHPEPFYNVRYAESNDGIDWVRKEITCIDFDDFTHAIGRPCVVKNNNEYEMFFSPRNSVNYRNDINKAYRLGYAKSLDGKIWKRMDHVMDTLNQTREDWNNVMKEYCTHYTHQQKEYLLYNGNGFGASGFGYAVREL